MKKKLYILILLAIVNIILIGCRGIENTSTTSEITSTNVSTTTETTSTNASSTTTTTAEETTTTQETSTLSTISQIKQGTVGKSCTTRATVVGISNNGVLLYDESDFIYVYLGRLPGVSVNDFVEVSGVTTEYGRTIQLGIGSSIKKIANGEEYSFTSTELSSDSITSYVNSFVVGDYVKVSGKLSVNGDYLNLKIPGTDIVGSLNTNDSRIKTLSGKNIIVKGFVLSYNDNSTKYLNILVTDVVEETVVDNYFPLTILTVNDLHGSIEQDASGRSGLSNMAYLINQIRNKNTLDDVILLANGDMLQGTAISNRTNGQAVIEGMNALNFDAMGIGNHEFDWGIETVLQYFDGEESNGEANFPLLNGNIYNIDDNTLLTVENGNVLQSVIIEKENVQVGVISYIGDVKGSISADKVYDYHFDLNIASSVKEIGITLKAEGVDVIVVNIHGGFSSNIEEFYYNRELANLKDNTGDYLVDIVINGHTHSYQQGAISRINGVPLPVIQAGSNGYYIGQINLSVDLNEMDVVDYSVNIVDVRDAGTNYDPIIEKIIDDISNELGDEVLVLSGETINSRSQLYEWVANVMLAATGADVAIHNTGGVRATGDIKANQSVTLSQIYEISPFDNTLWLVEMTYNELDRYLRDGTLFYSVSDNVNLSSGGTYTVVVISYVYLDEDYSMKHSINDIDTGLFIRDILVEDLRQKAINEEIFKPISNPKASIAKQYNPDNPQ